MRAAQTEMLLQPHVGPARIYNKGKGIFHSLWLILQVEGSVVPRILPWALLAGGYTAVLHTQVTCRVWPAFCNNAHPAFEGEDRSLLFMHTYPYQAILLATGFGLIFRLNQSLARYWEARTAAQNMAAKWTDAVLLCMSFDEEPSKAISEEKDCAAFARTLIHLMSLLHATALHMLRGDTNLSSLEHRQLRGSVVPDIPRKCGMCDRYSASSRGPIAVIGGLSAEECERLEQSPERAHEVLSWILRLITRRRKAGGLAVDAPILSRVHQFISDGNLWFLTALKVADTPFPFAHAQLNALICFINLGIFPVVVADKVSSLGLAIAISFCAIGLLFGVNEVAMDLEDPFTTDLRGYAGTNRLHAPRMQAHFDERLMAMTSNSIEQDLQAWPSSPKCYGNFLREAMGDPKPRVGARLISGTNGVAVQKAIDIGDDLAAVVAHA